MQLDGHVDVDHFRGDRGVVAKDVLNLLDRDAHVVVQRGARVPQVVEPDTAYLRELAPRVEVSVDVARLDQAARAGKTWLRLDAWRTNTALHDYYRRHGFTDVRIVDLPWRGSGALFQRPAATPL